MPRCVRAGAFSALTSSPRNSIVPALAGMSPQMTLNSVVLPAPFGPRIARRAPGATSRSTSRTAVRPPNRRLTPRRRRIGTADSVEAAVMRWWLARGLDGLQLAAPRQVALLAAGRRAARGRRRRAERAAEVLRHAGDRRDGLHRQLAVLHVQLLVEVGEDRLAVRVELDLAVRGGQRHLADRLLQLLLAARDVALDR